MGNLILEQAAAALNAAGIRAERAYPGRTMPAITDIAAAVSLGQAQLREKTVTVLVTVLSPASMGSSVCEEAALETADVLRALDSECTVAACRFDGKTGLFYTEVTAVFSEGPEITLGSAKLKHVVSFSAQRATDDEVTDIDGCLWSFRLEEFFPWGESEEPGQGEPFTLVNGRESYESCCWTSQKRVTEAAGTRQIREASVGRRNVD